MVINDDCIIALADIEAATIDSLITDPPAGISFMNKEWDKPTDFVKDMTTIYKECLRVLKPGAHGLVWAIPRTSHWTATALEQAGFEIRDVVSHLFGSGFPKSLDVSKAIDKMHGAERDVVGYDASKARPNKERFAKTIAENSGHGIPGVKDNGATITAPSTDEAKQWQGFGTALKPASEHWILVRKPLGESTVAKNVLKHGTGGLNIDASRIGAGGHHGGEKMAKHEVYGGGYREYEPGPNKIYTQGRFPANLVLSHNEDCDDECTEGCAVKMLDGQSGVLKSGAFKQKGLSADTEQPGGWKTGKRNEAKWDSSIGGASRFFYCAKASKKDRGIDNKHPTVKSTKLMEYLIRLITPPQGIVLDPFMGSGSTGVAAKALGFEFIGIERETEYFEIAERRINI